MTTFDSREKNFENKFAHDEELIFKARARRNHLLGLWAAEKHGKSGADAESHAKEFLLSTLDAGVNDTAIATRLHQELSGKHADLTEKSITQVIADLYEKAKTQIMGDKL